MIAIPPPQYPKVELSNQTFHKLEWYSKDAMTINLYTNIFEHLQVPKIYRMIPHMLNDIQFYTKHATLTSCPRLPDTFALTDARSNSALPLMSYH